MKPLVVRNAEDPFVLRCRGRVVDCRPGAGRVHVMGILNVTPDSFSDGGRYDEPGAALRRIDEMVEEGATMIDVGGESSRPRGSVYGEGAAAVTAAEEIRRVVPVIRAAAERHPQVVFSIDTYKAEVAQAALEAGASLLNDITGLRADPRLASLAATWDVPLALMHSVGNPGALVHEGAYRDVVEEVMAALRASVLLAREAGARQLLVDPGFGFGKTVDENLRLVACTDRLGELGFPVLVGISRKSTIGAVLGTRTRPVPVEERLFGSLGATASAVLRGARVVRTHDVRPTVELLKVLDAIEHIRREGVS